MLLLTHYNLIANKFPLKTLNNTTFFFSIIISKSRSTSQIYSDKMGRHPWQSMLLLSIAITVFTLLPIIAGSNKKAAAPSANAAVAAPIATILKKYQTGTLKRDGSEDFKIIGDAEFAGEKFFEMENDKVKPKPDAEELNRAYEARVAELNDPLEKAALTKEIDAAFDRLSKLLEAKTAIAQALTDYHSHAGDDKARERHRVLLGLSPTLPDRLLLSSRDYSEFALDRRWQEKKAKIQMPEPSVGYTAMREAAEMAVGHLNGAYNDLKKYAVVNTIRNANEADDARIFGFQDMAQLQGSRAQLPQRYSERLGLVLKLEAEIGAMPPTAKKEKKENDANADGGGGGDRRRKREAAADSSMLEMVKAAQQKLDSAFGRVMAGGGPMQQAPQSMGFPGQDNGGQMANGGQMTNGVQPLSKPGDVARNCGLHVHQCFLDRFVAGMAKYCASTCNQLGQDGKDVGTNCEAMAKQRYCIMANYELIMSKYCAASCRAFNGRRRRR